MYTCIHTLIYITYTHINSKYNPIKYTLLIASYALFSYNCVCFYSFLYSSLWSHSLMKQLEVVPHISRTIEDARIQR